MPDLSQRLQDALADRYRIERELGRGGMARVYLAEDLKHHRRVAIKVLDPEVAAAIGPERFLREIETVAQLTHPHILPLHDSGVADGLLFYVMPYVEGESLRDRLIREKQLPIDDALRIAREVADALSYAHSHGVVHRDVKPENILLESGHAVVADFGIARAVAVAGGATLTGTGIAVGTPAYMSPEQASGSPDLDGRSDLYSLGCMLYEMLAGQPPFTGPTVESLMHQHLNVTPRRVTDLRPSVDRVTCDILARTLAKTPPDRFATAADFARALENAIPPVLGATKARAPGQAPSIAVLPFANLSTDPEQEYFCDGIAEEIINALAHVEELRVVARTSSFAFKGRAQDIREIGRSLDVGALLEGSVRKAGHQLRVTAQLIDVATGYHLWSERFDRRLEDVFAIQDEIALAIVDGLKVNLLAGERASIVRRHTYSLEAYDAYLKGLFEWNMMTPEAFARCQELFREAIRLDPEFAPAYAQLADSFSGVTWWADQPPEVAVAQATPLVEKALALDPDLAHAHSVTGVLQGFIERHPVAAERSLRRAVELAPNGALGQIYLALFLMLVRRCGEEEAVARARLALRLDPLSPATHSWSGTLLCFSGQPEEGLRTLEQQVAATPHLWMPHYFLSIALSSAGRLAEARSTGEKAVNLSSGNSVTLSLLVCLCYLAGDRVRADELFERLRRRAEAGYVPPMFLARPHLARGEGDAALRRVEEALAAKDPWVSTHHIFSPGVVPAEPRIDALIAGSFG